MIVIKSHHAGNVEIGADGYPKRTKDRFDVYLNGEKLRFCVYANEEQGEAEVLKFAPNGKFEVSPYHKHIMTDILRGEVKIVRQHRYVPPTDYPEANTRRVVHIAVDGEPVDVMIGVVEE